MFRTVTLFTFLLLAFLTLTVSCSQKENKPQLSKYIDAYRPQYHFTPVSGWMNDPNGMFFYEGEYHLFYQHNPDSTMHGPMFWGHAVSKDLIHWEHLPIALYPDSLGYIYSGSVVVDWKNTSGLGTAENPPIVAIFTYHDPVGAQAGRSDFQTQGIAYSLDKGRTWKMYEQNPVMKNPGIKDFRDPKVSWNDLSNQWVMALAVKDHIEFYSSPDLKQWTKLSEFGNTIGNHGGVWECPDLFPLKDEDGNTKWVLFVSINPGGPQGGSATQYFIGDFDGKNFIPQDSVERWIDYGADNYAGVTWSDIPEEDGRRLFIGWMSNWQYANVVPTEKWRSATTMPREVSLFKWDSLYELKFSPVTELKKIMGKAKSHRGTAKLESPQARIRFELNKDEKAFFLTLSNDRNERLLISLQQGMLAIDRTEAGIHQFSADFPAIHKMDINMLNAKEISVYLDAASVEIFVDEGKRVMTDIVFPTAPFNQVKLEKKNSQFSINSISSIWVE
jgi:fructan beta-fructosidase